MVIEAIFNLLKNLIFTVFGFINLPDFPESLQNSLNQFLDIIFNGINLFGFFIRPATIQILIPILIVIINFDKIYKLTIWILKKIPMLGIE